MNIDLGGSTALVTGSTAGIGQAIARSLLAAGAEVVVNGRDGGGNVGETAARLGARGIAADRAARLIAELPDVDILGNNVGAFVALPVFEIDDESWRGIFEANVLSAIRLTQHYASRMAERGRGRVIFIGRHLPRSQPAGAGSPLRRRRPRRRLPPGHHRAGTRSRRRPGTHHHSLTDRSP